MFILYRKHKTKDWEIVEKEESKDDILLLEQEYKNSHDHSYMFKIEEEKI